MLEIFKISVSIYVLFFSSSFFFIIASRSLASIEVMFMLATAPWISDMNVFAIAIGAEKIASILNNEKPRTGKKKLISSVEGEILETNTHLMVLVWSVANTKLHRKFHWTSTWIPILFDSYSRHALLDFRSNQSTCVMFFLAISS